MTDKEFDLFLEETIDCPPPADLSGEFTPWRSAMNRIIWGTGWTTLSLNFLYLDVILPAVGMMMLFLGYRALRRENKWFALGYGLSWVRIIWWFTSFAIHSTIYSAEPRVQDFLDIGNHIMVIPGFLILLSLRNGIRTVQKKAGLGSHGGNGMLVWYVIVVFLAYQQLQGFLAGVLMLLYIFILIDLHTLSTELDEAGYAVSPAPVRISDSTAKRIFAGSAALALMIGFAFFSSYPMEWKQVTASDHPEIQEIREELLALGFPAHILEDLTEADLLSCKGALRIVVDVQDHPINDGREVVERDEEGTTYTHTVYDRKELRLTGIAVELPGTQEQWKIIHHFQWILDPGFRGTEVIQLWTACRDGRGWAPAGALSGQILYTKDSKVYSSPYYSLGEETYTSNSIFWGQHTASDIFAAFSMPNRGENHRGYVSYTIAERKDFQIIDSWINYTHQTFRLQYPVITAKQKHMTSGVGDTINFLTLQDALQFFPNEEEPKPLPE